jgi:hypothetical protein
MCRRLGSIGEYGKIHGGNHTIFANHETNYVWKCPLQQQQII